MSGRKHSAASRPKLSPNVVTELWYQRLSTLEEQKFDREVERFWQKVEKTDTCWIWTGARKSGYGTYAHGGEYLAHRFAYLITFGPAGDRVCRHTCDNPICVRPDHLVLGTHGDNIADQLARGRFRRGRTNQIGEANNRAKIRKAQAQAVLDFWAQGRRVGEIARLTGVSRCNASNIVNRRSWRHLVPNADGGQE